MPLPLPYPYIPDVLVDILMSFGFSEEGRALSPAVFVLLSILSWPIAIFLRFTGSAFTRLATSFLVGALTVVGVYGPPTGLVFLGFVSPFYILVRYLRFGPWLITVLVITVLSAIHYDSMLTNTSTDRMAYTGTLMVLTAKISMFGFHVDDGRKLSSGSAQLSPFPPISDHRRLTAILPDRLSFVTYLCYMFEFMGGIVGPLFTYSEFLDYVNSRRDFSGLKTAPIILPSLKAITRAVGTMGIYIYFSKLERFKVDTFVSSSFLELTLVQRILLAPIIAVSGRLAFYAVWSLSEVSCTLCGISFQPAHRFTRGRNINMRAFELSTNFNQATSNWNIRISELWLKNCIYQRVPERLKLPLLNRKAIANLITKLVSAVWHGWYSGFAVSFLSLGLCNWTESLVRRKIHPFLPSGFVKSRLFSILAWLHTWWSINIFFAPFMLLTWDKTATYFNSLYWFVHVYHFTIIVATSLIKSPNAKFGKQF